MRIDSKFLVITVAVLLFMGGLPAHAAEKSGSDSSNLHSEFMQAVVNGETDKIERLVDRGIDINERNEVGATALMWAVMKKQPDAARLLIKNGADLNARTDSGITALMVAVSEREPDMARLLVSAGADLKIKDQKGRTALDYARDQNDRNIVQVLTRDEQGVTKKNLAETREKGTGLNEIKKDESGIQAVVTGVDKPDNCLRIRKGPGRNFDKVGCLSFGDKVTLSGVTQDIWAQLEDPQKGWVSASQLKTEDGSVLGKKADSGKSVKSRNAKVESDSRTVEIETPYARVETDPETGGSVQLNTPLFSGQIDLGRVPGPFAPRAGALPAPPAGLPAPPPLFR